MDNHTLQQLLQDGLLTQEQFESYSEKATSAAKEQIGESSPPEDKQQPEGLSLTEEELNRRIQSAVDRATNKLGNEKKRLEEQITVLKREKLSDQERQALELSDKEKALADREAQILERENRLYTIKALKKAGLDDGSDISLTLADFVLAATPEEIDTRVSTFKKLLDKMVQAEVNRTFKTNGGTPPKGGSGAAADNPYRKESFNFTKQLLLEKENPELARQLAAQAGVR